MCSGVLSFSFLISRDLLRKHTPQWSQGQFGTLGCLFHRAWCCNHAFELVVCVWDPTAYLRGLNHPLLPPFSQRRWPCMIDPVLTCCHVCFPVIGQALRQESSSVAIPPLPPPFSLLLVLPPCLPSDLRHTGHHCISLAWNPPISTS